MRIPNHHCSLAQEPENEWKPSNKEQALTRQIARHPRGDACGSYGGQYHQVIGHKLPLILRVRRYRDLWKPASQADYDAGACTPRYRDGIGAVGEMILRPQFDLKIVILLVDDILDEALPWRRFASIASQEPQRS